MMRFKPFGIDIFCLEKKFLVFNMVSRNLKIKYRRSVFGILWTLLAPLSLVGVYYFVFKVVMQVQVPNYIAYLVSGILIWSFFSQTVLEGLDAFLGNASLITKIPIPLQVFPFVNVATNFFTLLLAVPIMLAVSLSSSIQLGSSLIVLPLFIFSIGLVCYGATLILSVGYVYFRDLKHLAGIFMQLWFYATPVLYRTEMIPPNFRWMLYANPVGSSFVAIHKILTEGTWPAPSHFAAAFLWSFVMVSAALLIFKSLRRDVAESL